MKLTAYDLSIDKSAILAAVLERTAPDETVKRKATSSDQKPPRKKKGRHGEVLERARVIAVMREAGDSKDKIMDVLDINSIQYDRAFYKGRQEGIIPKSMLPTRDVTISESKHYIDDLFKMPREQFAEKHGVSLGYVTQLRRKHRKDVADPYDAGNDARRRGMLRLHCPYGNAEMESRSMWLAGWHDADMRYAR